MKLPSYMSSNDRMTIDVDTSHPEFFKVRLRNFELYLQEHMDEWRCPVHLCLGQEEVPCALFATLRPEDWLFSTHRNHGHYLAKGGSESKLLAEIRGEELGVNAGFAGSQCFSDPSINFHASAIVGGLFGVAVGTALALKMDARPGIVVCCFGDGATEQGVFWESLNFAALWELPVAFICEDNGYSVHSPKDERQWTGAPLWEKIGVFLGWQDNNYFKNVVELIPFVRQHKRPAYSVIECTRECNHVGNMPDFRDELR